jgi:hypothetical protein
MTARVLWGVVELVVCAAFLLVLALAAGGGVSP